MLQALRARSARGFHELLYTCLCSQVGQDHPDWCSSNFSSLAKKGGADHIISSLLDRQEWRGQSVSINIHAVHAP